MPSTDGGPHPYRSAPAPRVLVARVGCAWRTFVGGAVACSMLLAVCGGRWLGECSVLRAWYQETGEHDGCIPRMRLVGDTTPLGRMPLCNLVGATVAPDEARGVKGGEESPVSWVATRWCGADGRRGSPPVEVRLAPLLGGGRGLFVFFAAVALLAPWLLTERATLRIDEGAGRACLVRRALWRRKRDEWPIERLREAEVSRSGLSVSVRLRLDGGETVDVAWPTWGDGGHAAFASQVNALLATRGRPPGPDRGSTGES